MESAVLVADFCRQAVDDFLYLLHSLSNLLAPQVHLGVRRLAKTVIGPEAPAQVTRQRHSYVSLEFREKILPPWTPTKEFIYFGLTVTNMAPVFF